MFCSIIRFLCTRASKWNMSAGWRTPGTRVGEDESFLLDCTRPHKEYCSFTVCGISFLTDGEVTMDVVKYELNKTGSFTAYMERRKRVYDEKVWRGGIGWAVDWFYGKRNGRTGESNLWGNPGADMMLRAEEDNTELVKNTEIFHFGTLSVTHEEVREFLDKR